MSLHASTSRSAYPSTPSRLGDSAINNAMYSKATPGRRKTLTPSRRVLSPQPLTSLPGSQQPLPTVSFAPLPNRVVVDSPALKDVIEKDSATFDSTMRAIREGKSERRRMHEGFKVELLEEERSWEQECERLRRDGADVVKALEREKAEVADATGKLGTIEERKRSLARQLEAVNVDLEEWAGKLEIRKDKNAQERALFEEQASLDKPELEFFEQKLGLRMEGRPRDVVAFYFTLLDPADHKRTFALELDASDPAYTIPSCKPAIPSTTLRALLDKLNENHEHAAFVEFIVTVRKAFMDLVDAENREKQGGYGR